jgi:hypothetical protein
MNGNLTNILRLAFILFPSMLKSTTKKRKVIITQHLYAIAYYPTITLAVLHEVNLHLPMPVHRIGVLLFMAFYQMIAILLREACDF